MNIIFVSPFPPLKDGLANYTKQFVDELRSRGMNVGVISSDHINESEGVGARIGLNLTYLIQAYRYLKAEQPDVVHVQYTIPAFGLASFPMWALLAIAKKRLGLRIVITFHEVKRETALLGPAGALYMRLMAWVADHITVHTNEAVRLLHDRCGVPAHKVSCITHPLYMYPMDKRNVTTVRTRYNLGSRPLALFFGFIHVDKGIDHLITAFAMARKTDPKLKDALLVIAGSVRKRQGLFKLFEKKDVEYEARLHHLVRQYKLSKNVRFTPYVPNEEVGSWFSLARVVVLPYTNLEQSGVLNLALGSNTPMIVSNLGGLGETMAGTNALVPPADDAALAAKLQDFLGGKQAARNLIAQYDTIRSARTVPVITDQLVSVYSAIRHTRTVPVTDQFIGTYDKLGRKS